MTDDHRAAPTPEATPLHESVPLPPADRASFDALVATLPSRAPEATGAPDLAELLARHRTAWIGYAVATDSKWVEEWERRGNVAAEAIRATVAALTAERGARETHQQDLEKT